MKLKRIVARAHLPIPVDPNDSYKGQLQPAFECEAVLGPGDDRKACAEKLSKFAVWGLMRVASDLYGERMGEESIEDVGFAQYVADYFEANPGPPALTVKVKTK